MTETHRCCFSCGTIFPPGGLSYQIHIQMAADFDGFIDADALDNPTDAEDVLTAISHRTAEELTEEVYRERTLLFCKRCAERAWTAFVEPQPRLPDK